MSGTAAQGLREALTAAAAEIPDVEERATPTGVEWLVRGRPFAALAGAVAEYRLEPVIARAALGTPDTSASSRGPDWIAFRPVALDRVSLDRAVAGLGCAHRRAAALRNEPPHDPGRVTGVVGEGAWEEVRRPRSWGQRQRP